MQPQQNIKIGLAGCGALGSIIARALVAGIPGYELIGISEIKPVEFNIPRMSFAEIAAAADLVIEALPPNVVPELAQAVLPTGKPLMLLSAAALLRYPEILSGAAPGQIQITAGALGGIDAVRAYVLRGIKSAKLISTKPPHALTGAPYLVEQKIDVAQIKQAECIFSGNAYEAAQGFPANTNVAATLALACTLPGQKLFDITVEIWADPAARGNSHKIVVETLDGGILASDIFSLPSPENPKSSPQAAYALLAHLQFGGGAFRI
jgi:aspartate dehydrogenase